LTQRTLAREWKKWNRAVLDAKVHKGVVLEEEEEKK